ncbi:hypothetical protein EYB26_006157 [Talaromyces marneffei]|uniref:Uncharacterized protein n=1 Tax=Talaromyces marneffei PM1 TaxID=1077442 RepID=A0A093V859_TALMA|nr:uncharacterized protein EYB26_006157 [Talaromyces marneffei]QGA18472.1 hypothetical protein EYB26_006157 [Talaromyces marneffei]
MSGLRGVMNNGWHPKGKDGSKESWRGDFKGINQVAGWMGKGKDNSKDDGTEHVSQPLASLKDPASFGPPPRRGDSRSSAVAASTTRTAPSGLGWTLSPDAIVYEPEQLEEDGTGPAPPPLPYRANRTGIDTTNLPPPPVRRTEFPINRPPTSASQPRPQPTLPPRLPARNTTSPSPPPPPYSEADHSIQMNQGSMACLEQAGISVPALGIGRRDSDQSVTTRGVMNTQVNELQTRFAKMSTPGSQTPQSPYSPVERPVSQRGFDNTPTSTYTTRSAAPLPPPSTNNFRQRSNEHIEVGKQKLTEFNKKHRITERIGSYFEPQPTLRASQGAPQPPPPPPPPHPNLNRQSSNIDIEVLNKRKPPPPPPPAKKPSLKSTPLNGGDGGSESLSPPPLPLGTKPR